MAVDLDIGAIANGLVLAALVWNARALHSLDRRLLVLETQLRPVMAAPVQAGE